MFYEELRGAVKIRQISPSPPVRRKRKDKGREVEREKGAVTRISLHKQFYQNLL